MILGRKKPINEYIQTNTIRKEDWEDYFEQLYHNEENTSENIDIETETEDEDMNMSITREMVVNGIKKLKNRKAPGEDGIANELIKYGGDYLTTEIHSLYNKIMNSSIIPNAWKKSITIPIFKKGNKKEPTNYRGITLLSSAMKLLTNIIATQLNEIIPMNEEQQGFRKNRSTTDAIFIIRQIAEKAIEYNKTAYICFVDLTKAFDRIKLQDVITIMKEKHVPNNIIRIIRNLNANNTTKVRVNNSLTKELPITTGIRQGDSLSPTLFNLIMDKITDNTKRFGTGYRMGNKEIKIICYADDVALISEDEDGLQRLLYNFNKEAEKYNMVISTNKTKCLTISKEPTRCKLVVDNNPVEQVMSFDYLGVNISSYGSLHKEVVQQTNKAAVVSGCLRDVIWRNKEMSTNSKVRIYKSCVRPIMTYAAETRAESSKTKRLMRTTEMKILRSITGKTLRDRIRSEDIRTTCETQDVVRWVRQRRRNWNEHVTRMDNDRIVKIARNLKPRGARLPGRPRKRWRDSWQSISQEQPTP